MLMSTDKQEIEIEPDPRESPFELPPVECLPFASGAEKTRAIRELVEQAEFERAASAPHPEGVELEIP
jgi:hypothetical protein